MPRSDKPSRSSGTGRSGGGGPRAKGSRDTKPAGAGDPKAPHARPGDSDNKKGGSKDPKAPYDRPGG